MRYLRLYYLGKLEDTPALWAARVVYFLCEVGEGGSKGQHVSKVHTWGIYLFDGVCCMKKQEERNLLRGSYLFYFGGSTNLRGSCNLLAVPGICQRSTLRRALENESRRHRDDHNPSTSARSAISCAHHTQYGL